MARKIRLDQIDEVMSEAVSALVAATRSTTNSSKKSSISVSFICLAIDTSR